MRIPALAFPLVLCSLLCVSIGAVAQTAPPLSLDTDPRLSRNVAVHAEGISVEELLNLLGRKTGVLFRADRYVADDKVIAFTPARPLRATLRDLAALYNDVWDVARLPDGALRYTLMRADKARRYEDSLEKQATARAQALLEAQVKALDETPQAFAKRPPTDFIRRNFESPLLHGRQATRLYAQLSPEQKESLFANSYLNISYVSSTGAQQTIAREAFGEVIATLKAIDEAQRVEHPEVHIVLDTPEMLARHGLRFRLTHTNNAGLSAEVLQVILGANTYMTMGSFESRDQWLLPLHGDPYLPKEKLNTADLPAAAIVAEAGKGAAWVDRLSTLAEKTQRPIFADYYRSPALLHDLAAVSGGLPGEPAPDPNVFAVDTLCRPSGYLWWKRGDTLLFRKRDWYTQRRYEVPDAWLRAMQQRLEKQKSVPTYGDLYQLLDLTPRQVSGLNAALGSVSTSAEGDLVDLDNQEGLPEMLRLIQAGYAPPLPVPMGIPTQIIRAHSGIDGGPNPQIVPMLTSFLNSLRLEATPENLGEFSVLMTAYTPAMRAAAQNPRTQNVSVDLDWKLGADNGVLNSTYHHWSLWLPLQVPYDRADKTKIDVE